MENIVHYEDNLDITKRYIPEEKQREPETVDQLTKIIQGDCTVALRKLPSNTIDLIVTSPPYADQRKPDSLNRKAQKKQS